ncbi:hypothetical protein HHI36_019669 [Cryptolaemus montrouzieri]|uniref:Uncharacterized protein n=1 Tax=Cryptolaemus montrouzieri TaxID=559131 RepID=A0ABD2N8T0_9CUCU
MSFGFEPTIFQHTRGTNCSDNILINFKNFRGYNSCVVDSGLSDHEAVDIVVDSNQIFQYKTKLPTSESDKAPRERDGARNSVDEDSDDSDLSFSSDDDDSDSGCDPLYPSGASGPSDASCSL